MGWLKLWWRQSDHYDRLSAHLQARGMDTVTRGTISMVAGSLALVALITMCGPTGPRDTIAWICTLASVAGASAGAVLWALRWPTRTTAIRFGTRTNVFSPLITLVICRPMLARF